MKTPPVVTADMLRNKVREGRRTLDVLRQLDNVILFDLGNPPHMDDIRGAILDSMRKLTGAIQEAEAALREGESR